MSTKEKLVRESLGKILKPKSKEQIERDIEEFKLSDNDYKQSYILL